MAKSEEEKAADAAEKARLAEEKRLADEAEAKQLAEESARVEAEKAKKDEENKKKKAEAEGTPSQDRKYSEAEVRAMLQQFAKDLKVKTAAEEDLDAEEMYKQKKVRLPRFQNKFVFSFENTNTDPYFPELIIHAFDVWNDQTKRNDPWVKAKFDDDSTLTVPLRTIIEKSQKVWVDLVEVIEEDISYSDGKVERAEVAEYGRKGTGMYVKQKVTMANYSYKIRLPDGKEVIVGKEVINW